MDDIICVVRVPQRLTFFVEVLAAGLQIVRPAEEVVLEEGERARVLIATTPQFPIATATKHLTGGQRLVPSFGGVAIEPKVVAELARTEFGEQVLADRAVPFAFVDPAWRALENG